MSSEEEVLNQRERIRYQRQLIIPEFGEEGQRRLKDSNVIITGIGGLGCASATYFVAAGVGRLLRFNGNDMKFQIDDIKRNESCKVCSPGLFN